MEDSTDGDEGDGSKDLRFSFGEDKSCTFRKFKGGFKIKRTINTYAVKVEMFSEFLLIQIDFVIFR